MQPAFLGMSKVLKGFVIRASGPSPYVEPDIDLTIGSQLSFSIVTVESSDFPLIYQGERGVYKTTACLLDVNNDARRCSDVEFQTARQYSIWPLF